MAQVIQQRSGFEDGTKLGTAMANFGAVLGKSLNEQNKNFDIKLKNQTNEDFNNLLNSGKDPIEIANTQPKNMSEAMAIEKYIQYSLQNQEYKNKLIQERDKELTTKITDKINTIQELNNKPNWTEEDKAKAQQVFTDGYSLFSVGWEDPFNKKNQKLTISIKDQPIFTTEGSTQQEALKKGLAQAEDLLKNNSEAYKKIYKKNAKIASEANNKLAGEYKQYRNKEGKTIYVTTRLRPQDLETSHMIFDKNHKSIQNNYFKNGSDFNNFIAQNGYVAKEKPSEKQLIKQSELQNQRYADYRERRNDYINKREEELRNSNPDISSFEIANKRIEFGKVFDASNEGQGGVLGQGQGKFDLQALRERLKKDENPPAIDSWDTIAQTQKEINYQKQKNAPSKKAQKEVTVLNYNFPETLFTGDKAILGKNYTDNREALRKIKISEDVVNSFYTKFNKKVSKDKIREMILAQHQKQQEKKAVANNQTNQTPTVN